MFHKKQLDNKQTDTRPRFSVLWYYHFRAAERKIVVTYEGKEN